MLDDATCELLRRTVRRESRSLFQYVREIPIWSSAADRPVVAKLKALAGAEEQAIDAIGSFLVHRKYGLAYIGAYPSGFTTFNDSAIHYLLPHLIREQKADIATLSAEPSRVTDDEARGLLDSLLSLKQRQLPELEALVSQPHTSF